MRGHQLIVLLLVFLSLPLGAQTGTPAVNPGLMLHLEAGGQKDVRGVRTVALFVPAVAA